MEDKFKMTEEILRNHKEDKSYLEMWKRNLEIVKNDVEGVRAVDYSADKLSPTHKFNSNIENEVIKKSDAYDLCKQRINEYADKVFMVENALTILTDREKTIIERRYFDKAKNIDIATELNLTEEYVCDLKRGIVQRLSDIIFLGKY
jgi:DNA-directed RNA polymerase specialized sigma subunit